jgi:hypothetical protein
MLKIFSARIMLKISMQGSFVPPTNELGQLCTVLKLFVLVHWASLVVCICSFMRAICSY